jgi:hypothetical protein
VRAEGGGLRDEGKTRKKRRREEEKKRRRVKHPERRCDFVEVTSPSKDAR